MEPLRRTLPLTITLLFGCVTEVRVGIEPAPAADAGRDGSLDAGSPDGEPDAGSLCDPSECAEPPLRTCPGTEPTCVRSESGQCEWQPGCDDEADAGPPRPCTTFDCEGPLLLPVEDRIRCGDGSDPVCTRDENGQCGYSCEKASSCGNQMGVGCGSAGYCAFNVGTCGSTSGEGGVCIELPDDCSGELDPVCGCDGKTYGSACEAARQGVNVALLGACEDEPDACTCEGPPPGEATPCPDDPTHQRGFVCLPTGVTKECGWQWLECPTRGSCGAFSDVAPGRCRSNEDCPTGQTCEGTSVCSCAASCFTPDTPGYCK